MKLRKSKIVNKENDEIDSISATEPMCPRKTRRGVALRNKLQFGNENSEKLSERRSIHITQEAGSQENVQFCDKTPETHSDNLQMQIKNEPASPEHETLLEEQMSHHNTPRRTKQNITKDLSEKEVPRPVGDEGAREPRRRERTLRKGAVVHDDSNDKSEDMGSDEPTPKENGFKCKICDKSFTFESNMKRHIQLHEPPSHRCDICGKMFKQARYLAFHAATHLSRQERLAANLSRRCVCGNLFHNLSNFKRHKMRSCPVLCRDKVKCVFCQLCRKKVLPDEYKQHEDVCTGEWQPKVMTKCKICSKMYTKKYMNQHLMRKHDIIRSVTWKYQSGKGNGFGRCPICNKECDTEFNLNRHKRFCERTISAKPYVCDLCNKHFAKKEVLATHIRRFHTVPRPVGDEGAREPRRRDRTLRKGAVVHDDSNDKSEDMGSDEHTPKESGFKCKICDKSFATKRTLKCHMQLHEPPSHRCDICGKMFKQARYLADHAVTHLSRQERLAANLSRRCVCGKLFQNTSNFRHHKQRACPVLCRDKVKCVFCQLCKKKVLPDEYKQHQEVCTGEYQRVRPIVRKIKCKICSKLYYKEYMREHLMREHDIPLSESCRKPANSHSREGNGGESCPICNKVFKTKSGLDQHHLFCNEQIISVRPYMCDGCNRHFAEKEVLARHIRRAHSNKYACDYCGKQFGLKLYLSRHITNVHMKEDFKPEFCPKAFDGISNDKLTDLIRGAFKVFSQ